MTTIKYFLQALKVEQSLFALPFAYTGMILAARDFPDFWSFIWVTIAMVGARNSGMAFNRVMDWRFDAANPRTADRHLPQGLLKPWQMTAVGILGLIVLLVASSQLNMLALILSPVAAVAVIGYSLFKRFTWLTHFSLGITLAIAPVGGWVAVTGTLSWEAVLLAFIVATFSAGFDIFNTCPDVEFDRKHGLHSVPVRFGLLKAFGMARLLHLFTSIALLALGILLDLALAYYIGWGIATGLLIYEHRVLHPNDLSKLTVVFTPVNALVGITILVFATIGVVG